jgi:hypothetical protein
MSPRRNSDGRATILHQAVCAEKGRAGYGIGSFTNRLSDRVLAIRTFICSVDLSLLRGANSLSEDTGNQRAASFAGQSEHLVCPSKQL